LFSNFSTEKSVHAYCKTNFWETKLRQFKSIPQRTIVVDCMSVNYKKILKINAPLLLLNYKIVPIIIPKAA